jgi:spore coat protein A
LNDVIQSSITYFCQYFTFSPRKDLVMKNETRSSGSSRREFIKTISVGGVALAASSIVRSAAPVAQAAPVVSDPRFTAPVLDPAAVPKFVDPVPVPGATVNGTWPVLTGPAHVVAVEIVGVQVLPQNAPGFPQLITPCGGYRTSASYVHTYLGPTIVGVRDIQTTVTFDYSAIDPARHLLKIGSGAAGAATVVDKHVHGTDMGEPEVRFIAHKHGSVRVRAESDGYAESWVAPDGKTAATFNPGMPMPSPVGFEPGSDVANARIVHNYPNAQGACTAWYHDHALGITRLNVYAGLAGAFLITDAVEADYIDRGILPSFGGHFDIPLVIQDRMFYPDGSLAYPDQPFVNEAGCTNWSGGPSTLPEFFGDCMLVNGKTWPFLEVEPATYRLRFLNGCNSRFLDLEIKSSPPREFKIIGTEGGFLPAPVAAGNLLMGPAERFDVLFDFAPFAGKTLTLTNKGAKKPFPKGTPPRPGVDGIVMQFRVNPTISRSPEITTPLPNVLNPAPAPASRVTGGTTVRRVLLFEGVDEFGRIQPMLGQVTGTVFGDLTAMPLMWDDPVTETPRAGAVEIWEIYNTTMDAHPIHLHEILFSVLNRQPISFDHKSVMSTCVSTIPPFPVRLKGNARPSELYERGFKDTVITYPGEVTRIAADFTTANPGRFVWHCHILEHEDHEMMRPYDIV